MVWVLLVSLCTGCSGRAQSEIEMKSKEACIAASQTFGLQRAWAYCVNRETGEVIIGRGT
jgi:hypothetical protein